MMTIENRSALMVTLCVLGIMLPLAGDAAHGKERDGRLPPPRRDGAVSLERALANRRSPHALRDRPLAPADISQLLWAAQGTNRGANRRTAPSAGALYPLELYVVTAEGVMAYVPDGHRIRPVLSGDRRPELHAASFEQDLVLRAPAVFVITAVIARTARKYGAERGRRYALLEAGHAAQNLLLQASALGLAARPIGAFDDRRLRAALGLSGAELPLYLIPVGLEASTDR